MTPENAGMLCRLSTTLPAFSVLARKRLWMGSQGVQALRVQPFFHRLYARTPDNLITLLLRGGSAWNQPVRTTTRWSFGTQPACD